MLRQVRATAEVCFLEGERMGGGGGEIGQTATETQENELRMRDLVIFVTSHWKVFDGRHDCASSVCVCCAHMLVSLCDSP